MFKIKKYVFLLGIAILSSFHCFSQVDSGGAPMYNPALAPVPAPTEEIFYRGSVQAGGGVVFPVTNKALRISLNGEYYFHLSVNYIVAPHIFAGLEFEDTQLANTNLNPSYDTRMFIYSPGIKVGYYTFMQRDFLFCYSLTLGPSLITYADAPNSAPKGGFRQQSYFMTPSALLSYRVNDELRIGFEFSYILMAYRFDPTYTGIAQYIIYNPSKDANAITTYFEGGFGLYWAFSEAKK